MKKIIISTFLMLMCTITFAQKVEGKWVTTIETDNGPYTFYADYVVKGDTITGRLSSVDGSVEIYNGKIKGDEFEYAFQIDYNELKHAGKWVDGKLEVKSSGDYGKGKFTMTRVEKE